jgi:gliding motility-associated-like protein
LIRKTYDETNEKQLNFCTQMKLYLVGVFCFLISYFAFNQSLIINEVSQGPSGSKEYVELLVIPSITNQNCETCMDLRGWIIDDNNGYFSNGNTSGTGVAAGAVRFSNDAIWSCVPFGTLIVIYNQADVNVAIPAQDVSLSDNNCRLILPVSSNLLEFQTVSPGSGNTTYPTSGWTAGGSLWGPLGMSNNDDSFQTYSPTNTLIPTFGVSWENNNSNNIIYFTGGTSNTVFFFANTISNDPFLQSNWISGTCAAPDNQTPGSPNNPANAIYISQLNNSCQPILPITSTSLISDETCSCNGSVTITPTGGIPNYTYNWTNASNTVIGQTATLSNLCAGTYSCEVTTSNGCTYDTIIVIPLSPAQTTPTFDPIGPFCAGTNFTLPTSSSNGISGAWSPNINNAVTTEYTFTPTDLTCASPVTLTVVISNSVTPTFSQLGPYCIGDVFTLPSTSTNGIQGSWSPVPNTAQTTDYTFSPINNTCATQATMTIAVSASTTPSFTPINPICLNGTAPALPQNSTNGIAGTWNPAQISTTTAGNFNYTFSPSSGQCASVTSQNVTITNPITPTFSAIGPFCINSTPTNLPNQSAESVTGTWSPAIINTSVLGSANYTFSPSTGFCATTYVASVFIGDNSVNAGVDQTVCEGESVTLLAQGTPPFIWNNSVVNANPFNINQTTIYTVSSTQNGCTATDNVTIFVTPNPNVDFTFTPVTGNAPLSVVFSNQTINGTSYTWDFGNGSTQNINSALDVSQIYSDGGVYSITLYASNNGCVDSITYNLIVLPDPNIDLNVPNVFSPNDDLSNDVYSLNFENAKALNAIIVNRWGNVIFTFTSPTQTWDGTSNGTDCPDGVYFVKYEVTSINDEIFKGQQFIHLIR